MYNFIKDKSRFLIFDVNSRFISCIPEEKMKEITIRNVNAENFGMPIIDALELLEETTKVIYNIETQLIGIPGIINLIDSLIDEIIKIKNENSGNYAIIVLNNRNFNKKKINQLKEKGKNKDIDIVLID